MTISKEAAETAARAYDPEAWTARDRLALSDPAVTQEELYTMVEFSLGKARDMLTAALPDLLTAARPAIERQIREEVAKEIEARIPTLSEAPIGSWQDGVEAAVAVAIHTGMTTAAKIARGKDQA